MEALLKEFDIVFLLELLMLWAIMVVGFYTSYTDIRFRDIPPFAIWSLLIIGLLGQFGFWVLGKVELWQILLIFIAGFGVGYLLYLYGFWAPGDAKLFWTILIAMPPTLCPPVPFFSFNTSLWALWMNAVVFSFIPLLLVIGFRRIGSKSKVKPAFSLRGWLHSGLEIAGLTGLMLGGALLLLGRTLSFMEAAVGVLVLYLVIERLIAPDYRLMLILPGIALGVYVALAPKSWVILLALWVVAWGIQSVYVLIRGYYGNALVQSISIEALQEGMVPAVFVYPSRKAERDQGPYVCKREREKGRHEVCQPGQPLSSSQVHALHDLNNRGLLDGIGRRLEIETPVPFAPFIVLSAALTPIIGGSLALPLMSIVRRWVA